MLSLNRRKWNDGNLDLNPCRMKRVHVNHEEMVDTVTADALALAFPDGHSVRTEGEAGRALFRSPELATHWTTTLLDTENRRYHAVLVNPELAVGKLEVTVNDAVADGGRPMRLDLTYTALSEQGNALFDDGLAGRMREILKGHARSLASGAGPARGFEGRIADVRREVVIRGGADEIFALACPVAELDWVDDWHFDLVYSESGRNEDNNLILEPATGLAVLRSAGSETYWYTTLYDTDRQRFHAVLLTRDVILGKWQFEVEDLGDGRGRLRLRITYTGLTEEGNRIIGERGFEDRMGKMLEFLLTSAKSYVETGRIFRLPRKRKMELAISLIGATIGRHFRRRAGRRSTV